MPVGTVKMWNPAGWGFIKPDTPTRDVFAHRNDLLDGLLALEPGQRVEYQDSTSPRNGKTCATAVRVI